LRNFGKNNMKAEEKIYKVLERIKSKTDLAPVGSVIDYRAGWEINEPGAKKSAHTCQSITAGRSGFSGRCTNRAWRTKMRVCSGGAPSVRRC
jgi:hypothetical protein